MWIVYILLFSITILIGSFVIKKVKTSGLAMTGIIITFWSARMIFARAWETITGNITAVSLDYSFWIIFLANIVFLSVFFIVFINRDKKFTFKELGWSKHKLIWNLATGILISSVFAVLMFKAGFLKTDPAKIILVILISFLIASWQEENIYRGYLINYLHAKGYGQLKTNVIQALIFSIAHIGFTPWNQLLGFLLMAFIFGLVFGFIRLRTKSQIPAFMLHGVIDFFSWL